METEKKQWTKPELIALVRSKPEEAVLSACKALVQAGPVQFWVNCEGVGGCVACAVNVGS
jgi:hypothetical protein